MKILLTLLILSSQIVAHNAVIKSRECTKPNTNFWFCSNLNLLQKINITYTQLKNPEQVRTCMNTVSSFYPGFNCSCCEHFVNNPSKWGFEQVDNVYEGDVLIFYDSNNHPWHAVIVDTVKDGKVIYFNHSNGGSKPTDYIIKDSFDRWKRGKKFAYWKAFRYVK